MKRLNGRPLPLGTTVCGKKVNFSVAVEEEKECKLLLYKAGAATPEMTFEMTSQDAIGEVRFLALEGLDVRKYEYNYEIDGEVVVDPYAKELAGREEWGSRCKEEEPEETEFNLLSKELPIRMPVAAGKEALAGVPSNAAGRAKAVPEPDHSVRGRFASDNYDWEEDKLLKIPADEVVAYNLHVRGFTKNKSSKVRKKGTFTGVIEKIPYLQELGVNQIHCMPVYEFEECTPKKINYWGYGPAYCFAPKSAYAHDGRSVRGLKDMVKACHKAGIEVILNFPFDASIHPQMMVACLHYYMMEYHVDGFVLNPVLAPMNSILTDPILKGLKILTYDDGFQTVMRRYLKGDEGMIPDVMWQFRNLTQENRRVNYITNHTGFTLNDLVSYDGKHNEANGEENQDGPDCNYSWNCGAEGPVKKKTVTELRARQMRNAFLLLLLAQGVPCILAGDEFANTQNGNNNVYCQDNETGWLSWNKFGRETALFEYVKELIAFRKKHPVLHQKKALLGLDKTSAGIPDISYHGENAWQVSDQFSNRQIGIYLSGAGVKDDDCFIAYNMHWVEHEFAVPAQTKGKKWYQAVTTDDGVLKEMEPLGNVKKITVPARTIVVLVGK